MSRFLSGKRSTVSTWPDFFTVFEALDKPAMPKYFSLLSTNLNFSRFSRRKHVSAGCLFYHRVFDNVHAIFIIVWHFFTTAKFADDRLAISVILKFHESLVLLLGSNNVNPDLHIGFAGSSQAQY